MTDQDKYVDSYMSPKLRDSCNTSLKAEGLLLCCHKLMLAAVSGDAFR